MKPIRAVPDYTHKEWVLSGVEQAQHREVTRIAKPYPQYHRVVLRSADRDAGTSLADATFSFVSVPDYFHGPAVLMLEQLNVQNTDGGAMANAVVEVHARGLHHPRSWDSRGKGPSDLLATFSGYAYQNQSPSTNGMAGIPVADLQRLQMQPLSLYFLDGATGQPAAVAGPWVATLCVVSLDESVRL